MSNETRRFSVKSSKQTPSGELKTVVFAMFTKRYGTEKALFRAAFNRAMKVMNVKPGEWVRVDSVESADPDTEFSVNA